jgi:glycosyltransferase involved in cell wall biosynthesis
MRNMRVAFITPASFEHVRGGGERYVLNLARGVARASAGAVEVEVVVPGERSSRRALDEGVWLRSCRVEPSTSGPGSAVSWELIEAALAADVIHMHQVFTLFGESVVLAARASGRPLCVTDHGGWHSTAGRELGLLHLADAVVAYSRFGAAALGTSQPVTVVEGGVDTRFFSPGERELPREHVLFVGRILPHKGVDVLVRACPRELRLVIAGTAPDPEYLEEVEALARDRSVTFVLDASDEQIRDLYRGALAVAAPSVYVDLTGRFHAHPELMCLAMLEGMACAAPAVCLRTGALPEYVEEGVTGFVADDEAGLTECLTRLAADPVATRRMGVAARERVCARWDLEVAGRRLLDLYRQLVAA